MHTHTVASTHAYSTITENAVWAAKHGIKYLGMTDHGVKMQDAPDTWHFENLRILPDVLENVRVFKGIEANIIGCNGEIDIPRDVESFYYSILEWVNVSMHLQCFRPSTRSEHTKAYLNVLKNKYVDVICHSESVRFDYDFDDVIKACADSGRLIEINECRLERPGVNHERYLQILDCCVKYGTRIIVSSDAHFYTHIGAFEKADSLIGSAGFPEKLVVNADEEQFLDYIKSRNERINRHV